MFDILTCYEWVTTKKKRKKSKEFEKKESYKWVEALKKVPEVLEKVSSNNDQAPSGRGNRESGVAPQSKLAPKGLGQGWELRENL